MQKVLVIISMFFSGISIVFAGNLQELYLKADFVAHIRIEAQPYSSGFTHDLGTTWYEVKFVTLEVHKNRDTANPSTFRFVHYEYEKPDVALFRVGTEWIVCLSRTGLSEVTEPYKKPEPRDFQEPALMKGGHLSFDARLNNEIRQVRMATPFDRAVTEGDFEQVEQIISDQVQLSSLRHRKDMALAVTEITTWLRSFTTVDVAVGDSCAIHICIYPGWYDLGIRFLTEKGPREYVLTLSLGKVIRMACLGHLFKSAGHVDRVFFLSFRQTPGIIEQIYQTCLREEFQRKQGWFRQDGVEISITPLQDTIWLISGQMQALRVRVKFLNTSQDVRYILWPAFQTVGFKQISLRLHDEEGNVLEEEELFPLQQDNGAVGVKRIGLLPGDSLVGYHSINDYYGAFTDATANHFFPWLHETRYLISLIYHPTFDGDSSLNWMPEGGSREVFYHLPLPALFVHNSSFEETLTARLISLEGYCTNNFGQQYSYDGLVEIIGNLQGSRFKYGDTLAFRSPYNMYDRTVIQSHPTLDFHRMQAGDLIHIDVNGNYPEIITQDANGRQIRIAILANRPDALRIIY